MKNVRCYYGNSILKPSCLEVYDKHEASIREIRHINPSFDGRVNIWLKTYGLKDFLIECDIEDAGKVIEKYKLIKSEIN